MTKPRVLISDKLSQKAVEIFEDGGVEVDFKPGLSKDELIAIIDQYDGLAIRSATRVTPDVFEKAQRLKVVGRAGIGVDNVDLPAASQKGVVVMNTPFGNSITTAEHAIAMMMALARQIPEADVSTQAGKWEKSKFMGVEITGKTLGIIGCGNIGSIVASRALGLKMKVIAFDPYLSEERAVELGIKKGDLDDVLKAADFLTLHTPLTDKTRNIINTAAIFKMKKGVRIINCARGGLVDEAALAEALKSGHVAGAAFDVFAEEPATDNVLFGLSNVICTPHLGAATSEAQEKVAEQVAEQMAAFLTTGAITNAVNFPSISAQEAPVLKPFVDLSDKLGFMGGQLMEKGLSKVQIVFEGEVGDMNTKALSAAVLAGVLRPLMSDMNMIAAPSAAKEKGIQVEEIKSSRKTAYPSLVTLHLENGSEKISLSGTVFADGSVRLVKFNGMRLESEFYPDMLYIKNQDKPGFVGALGALLGEANTNIAAFTLGRDVAGGSAISLVGLDSEVDSAFLGKLTALPQVVTAQKLKFAA